MPARNVLVDGGVNNARTLASGDQFANIRQRIYAGYADLGPAGTSTETLTTDEITGGFLASNGSKVEAMYCSTLVSTTNQRRHSVTFAGTIIADISVTSAGVTGTAVRVLIIRESSTVVRCYATYDVAGATPDPSIIYTRITGLNLATNYDLSFRIRNLTTNTDSTLRQYTIDLTP